MTRALLAACLLAGCSAQPAFRRGAPAPGPRPPSSDFSRAAGAAASRHAGTVLSAQPALVRLAQPDRPQPEGVLLVAREPDLRPAALLRVISRRGAVVQVAVERGAARAGLEVVEPSPALAAEAARLPAAR
ncbi:MAG: hypothetical protein ACK5VI_03490 [Opitutia bacterium]